jgi:hypothetical protein
MDRVSEKAAFLRRQAEKVKAIAAEMNADRLLAASLARDFERRAVELEAEAQALAEGSNLLRSARPREAREAIQAERIALS